MKMQLFNERTLNEKWNSMHFIQFSSQCKPIQLVISREQEEGKKANGLLFEPKPNGFTLFNVHIVLMSTLAFVCLLAT